MSCRKRDEDRRDEDRRVRDLTEDRANQAYGLAAGCAVLFILFTGLILALSSF